MNVRTSAIALSLLAVAGWSTAVAQQRVEFQRQKFDRSRFERPDPTERPTPAPAPAPAAEPVGTWSPAPAGAPAPMATEAPAPAATPSTGFPAEAPAAPSEFGAPPPGAAPGGAVRSGPPPSYPAGATPEERAVIDAPLFDQVPSKWFNNAKDYPELVELQKKTGACMLVYFKNPSVPNEKGLCSWFEKSITTDIDWRKAMKYFIKLEITLPGPSAVRDLTAQFRVVRTPSIFVVKPTGGMPYRLPVFSYPEGGGRPTPIPVPDVLASLKAQSTPAYQTLF